MFFSSEWQDKLVDYVRTHPEIVDIRFSMPEDKRWWVVAINWVRSVAGMKPWIAHDQREECARLVYHILSQPAVTQTDDVDHEPF